MSELRWVPTEKLLPNPWNPNRMDDEMYAKAIASIRRFGFVDPVTVRAADPFFEIIDGEHRRLAAKDEKLDEIPIFNLGIISDDDARQLTIVLNETRGQSDPQKLGSLLRDLSSRISLQDLLNTLPFSQDAFERLTGLQQINWEEMNQEMNRKPLSTWVERTYRMPIASAEVIDQAIARWHRNEDGDGQATPDWQILEFLAADYLGS